MTFIFRAAERRAGVCERRTGTVNALPGGHMSHLPYVPSGGEVTPVARIFL